MKKETGLLSWLRSPRSDIWLFVIVVVLLNLVASRAFLRFDLTASRSYSLSRASKETVRMLDEPLGIKVFFSDNLPYPYSGVKQYVQDILSEYQMAAKGNFTCEFFDMDSPENQNLARGYGLQQVQIREVKVEDNEVGYRSAFMGIVLTYADQIEKLDGIISSDGLEYKITTAVSRIVSATNALTGMGGRVKLTLFKSPRLADFGINGFDEIDGAVQSAYEAANKKFRGRVDFETVNPASADVPQLVQKYGIQAISWKENDGSVQYGALGLVVELGDTCRTVPLEMVNLLFSYAVQGLDDLDDAVAGCIQGLVSRTSVIAYVTNHGELGLYDSQSGAAAFASLVEDKYSFKEIDLSREPVPAGVQCVVINGPKSEFSDEELYRLDQFLLRGGNVMLFLDPFNAVEPEGQMAYYQQPEYVPNHTGLERLLESYGMSASNTYVLDERCYSTLNQQYGRLNFYYAPQLQKEQLDAKHPISQNLGYVIFLQSGALDASAARQNADAKVTVLAKSSPASWTVDSNFTLSPLALSAPSDKSAEKSYDLCVLVEGKFDSAFDGAPQGNSASEGSSAGTEGAAVQGAVTASSHIARSTQPGKIFVAATSYITGPQILQEGSTEPVALLLANAVDYMNGRGELCAMRTKGQGLDALRVTRGPLVNAVKYFNIVGLALIVAVCGLLVLLSRRRHRNEIRMLYNPHDGRESAGNASAGRETSAGREASAGAVPVQEKEGESK